MPQKKPTYQLNKSPFFRLTTKGALGKIFFMSHAEIEKLSRMAHNSYSVRPEQDEKGKLRTIEEPINLLRSIHERIKELLSRVELPEYVFSPKKGVSTSDNAQYHQGNRCCYELDIKRYYPSTSQQHVFHFFHKKMECSRDVAGILAQIISFQGHLPTGSPASPIMSYYANLEMWERIHSLVSENNCKFSVWVDDICISGELIPNSLIWQVKKAIHISGFEYHKEKRYSKKQSKNITGIITTKSKTMPKKGQHLKLRNLRKEKDKILKSSEGIDPILEKLSRQIEGNENYINQVTRSQLL